MIRGVLVGLVALVASANAFVGLVAVPRTATCSAGRLQMVTQPRVSSPASAITMPPPLEPVYTAKLKKMEEEMMAELEEAFNGIAAVEEAKCTETWNGLQDMFYEKHPELLDSKQEDLLYAAKMCKELREKFPQYMPEELYEIEKPKAPFKARNLGFDFKMPYHPKWEEGMEE